MAQKADAKDTKSASAACESLCTDKSAALENIKKAASKLNFQLIITLSNQRPQYQSLFNNFRFSGGFMLAKGLSWLGLGGKTN